MQNDVCAEFDTRRLCSNSSNEGGNMSVLIENLILMGGPMSRICDITNNLKPILVQYSTCGNMKPPGHIHWELTFQ